MAEKSEGCSKCVHKTPILTPKRKIATFLNWYLICRAEELRMKDFPDLDVGTRVAVALLLAIAAVLWPSRLPHRMQMLSAGVDRNGILLPKKPSRKFPGRLPGWRYAWYCSTLRLEWPFRMA